MRPPPTVHEPAAAEAAVALEVAALKQTLAAIVSRRRDMQSPETDPGFADREAMGQSLVAVLEFCRRLNIEAGPLLRLNDLLAKAHTTGVATGLQGPSTGHRPPDLLEVQALKGALAGLVAARRRLGERRKRAASWVAANIPRDVARRLSGQPVTAGTILEWHDRYSGAGDPGVARDRFNLVASLDLSDAQCKAVISGLAALVRKIRANPHS